MNIINKVLIAGAKGNIGSFLFEKLNKEYMITRLDYDQESFEENSISLDLTDKEEVKKIAKTIPKGITLIFLVGLAHKKGKGQELDEFRRINKQTLVNLLFALEHNNNLPSKIIFASTISVYGEKINQNIYHEDSIKESFSPYAVTKLEAEDYLLENYSSITWILRFAPVYAPGFHLNIDRRTKVAGTYYKVGNGEKKLSLCNLENIGATVKSILENKVPADVYNISDKESYTYNHLLKYVNAKSTLNIPAFLVKGVFYLGVIMNNIFLKENCVKLITDNTSPSDKISMFIKLPSTMNEVIKND